MAVKKFLVYVTCFCLSQDLVFCDVYGESGNVITLTPMIRGRPEDIVWKHNDNKVLEYDGSEVLKYGLFEDRVNVDFETGELIIRKLNSQDSGKYQSEILINGIVQTSVHTLTVLDPLPDPRVTCEVDENSNVNTLSCSVESQTQPSYEWSGSGVKQLGPTLLVTEQEENRDSVYTCTVKDKLGSKSTDFNLQDCHTGRVNLAVLVPVIIVPLLLIILLAVLALYIYRCKNQKRKSGLKKMDLENGDCNNLLSNVPMEAMPGSFEATLPCRTRLTAPKESIADKNWDLDSEFENAGEIHEEQQLLKKNRRSTITEKNKDDTANTGELDEKEKNGENEDEAEENNNSKDDETDTEEDSQKSLQIQEEMVKSQTLNKEGEDEKESPEKQIETVGEQDTKYASKNEEDQKPAEKKEEELENEERDSPNTDEGELEKNQSEHADEADENANSKADKTDREVESQKSLQTQEEIEKNWTLKNGSEGDEESPEEQTLGEQDTKDADTNKEDQTLEEEKEENEETDSPNTDTVSPQSTMTGRSTVGTGNVAEQLHNNEKSSQNENGEQSEEQQNKSLCTSVNEHDQKPDGGKEEEAENHDGTDSPSTLDISVPSSNLNMELENKQAAVFPQEKDDDDDGKQTDKSSESEKDMEKKMMFQKLETENKLLKDCDVKNSNPDDTNNDTSVPEDKKAETEPNNKHAMKEDHS